MTTTLAKYFDTGLAWIACVLAGVLTAVVMLGIITRELGDPLIWTDEVSRFLMIWLAIAGWLISTRKRAHIRINFFHDLLPAQLWWLSEAVMQAALVACGVLLAVFGFALIGRNLDIEATTVPIAMAWIYAPIAVAGIVTALQGLAETTEAIVAAYNGRRRPGSKDVRP